MVTSQACEPFSSMRRVGAGARVPRQHPRNVAVDAYRGLVMVLMMGEVLRFAEVARAFPGSTFWRILAYNQTHVEWAGMSLHDTIQPGFTFLAGVALPYSITQPAAQGRELRDMLLHTMWRSLLLVALGIFLRSTDSPITYYTFEDTLTQIGLGYTFAFLLAFAAAALAVDCAGRNSVWVLAGVGAVSCAGRELRLGGGWRAAEFGRSICITGFAAHWNKNSNLGQCVRCVVSESVSADEPVCVTTRADI